jgi:hypothetical protein
MCSGGSRACNGSRSARSTSPEPYELDGALPTESRLVILPGLSHYNILGTPQLPSVVAEFAR